MNKNDEILGQMPIGKLLFKLSIPAVLAQVINMLYNLVDRIYIGHIGDANSLPLTGMGVCFPLITILASFAALVSMGSAPRASVAMGRQDYDEAQKILGNSVSLLVIVATSLTVLVMIFKRPILILFGANPETTLQYALDYINIYVIGTIFVHLTIGLNAFIAAQGYSIMSMCTTLIGAVLNIILDPIFIICFNMGVKGAALATIISQCVSCVWCVLFLISKKSTLKIKLKNMKLIPKIFLPCIALGIAPFIMQFTESIMNICFNSSLRRYGGDIAVGAMTIFSSVMQFTMLPVQGIGAGAQPIAGYNYGAKNADRLKKVFKLTVTICLIYTFTLWSLVMIFPQLFVKVFTPDTALIEYSTNLLRVYLAGTIIFGIQSACQTILVAIDKPIASVFVAILRKIILIIPLIYILPLFMGNKVLGVILAEPISDIIAVTCTSFIFAHEFKKAIKSITTPQPNQALESKQN